MDNNNNTISDNTQKEDFVFRNLLDNFLVHWHWFVIAIAISLFATYTYLRYTIPQYQTNSTILVKDDKKGGMSSQLGAFSDLGLGKGLKNNVDNEMEILKSRTLIESTIRKLNFNVSLFVKGKIVSTELYKDTPVSVDFINAKPDFDTSTLVLDFVELTPTTFSLKSESVGINSPLLKPKIQYRYGEQIPVKNADLIISKSTRSKNNFGKGDKSIKIVVQPIDNVVGSYFGALKVEPLNKSTSILKLSIIGPSIKKAEDFLNSLVQVYNNDAAADKNFISESTSKFIANRLILITKELDGVEMDVESFKRANNITDIASESSLSVQGSVEYNRRAAEKDIQLNVISSLFDFLKKNNNSDLLPANLIAGGDASASIGSYNQLILQRNRILKSATLSNPTVIKLDQEISSLRANVLQSLSRLQSSLNIEKANLNNLVGDFDSKKEKIPVQERLYRVIERQQKVKEQLYLYLLQKREETAISMAATEPNARVIDGAMGSKTPVAPKKNVFYLAALLFGILIPLGIIFVIDLLDTKVKTRTDITSKFSIPFLGDIPKSDSPNQILETTSRSSAAEAMRIVRANIDFMLTEVPDDQAKTIFFTSTIPGEGKTFLSVNLASVFAISGKKVLLIGLDVRNPKLLQYFDLPNKSNMGLTNYLSSNTIKIEDCIMKATDIQKLDILPSGSIPPNPTELLMSKKIDELFEKFKKEYDYIIVDTAPVSLVSDTLILAKFADTFVYVVRSNYLDKRMLAIPNLLNNENKLPNMAILLNDTYAKRGYGYGGYGYGGYGYGGYGYGGYGYGGYGYGGYGYGETKERRPWYKKIFNR